MQNAAPGCIVEHTAAGRRLNRPAVQAASKHGSYLSDNSINESLSVHSDDQSLGLKPMGMPSFGSYDRKSNLSQEGTAEYYWDLFVRALQQ